MTSKSQTDRHQFEQLFNCVFWKILMYLSKFSALKLVFFNQSVLYILIYVTFIYPGSQIEIKSFFASET